VSGGGGHYRTIMVSIVALCAAAPVPCSAQSAPRDRYVAPWIALPQAESVTLTASGKNWTGIVALRAKSLLVLNDPVRELTTVEPLLEPGTMMIALDEDARIACEFERPKGRYFVHCVEDYDANGSYDGYFLLNNTLPFLFWAIRQPRHRETHAISRVTLRQATDKEMPDVQLALGSRGQLCVLRQEGFNVWGDRTEMSGCLAKPTARRSTAQHLTLAGRTLIIERPDADSAKVTVSAQPLPVAVEF
jgi:hypothetical protein